MKEPCKSILVLGGTSDIGRATALAYAMRGWRIQLAGRNKEALRLEADNIAIRSGATVTVHHFDVLDQGAFHSFAHDLPALPDTVVCVVGVLGDQRRSETDLEHATLVIRSNYEGPALILGLFAERFIERGSGTIVGVSSVAGARGRASNYVYGSAKAGFTAFLSGLRNRCAKHGVHVVTIKPGFVRTRMTDGMNLPPALTITPAAAAAGIINAAERKRDIVYVSRRWSLIMTIINHIPEQLFKKMSI
jgi:decaprenylphospho-beta-D-erythro-pentofuranosid-2-ulose 2-reductase